MTTTFPASTTSGDLPSIHARGYGAEDATSRLAPMSFDVAAPTAHEVQVQVMFCGLCHTDIHMTKNEWGNAVYPVVPGHEAVGRVSRIGDAVTAHAVGDVVGIGYMVGSCGTCTSCEAGEENYCEGNNGMLQTSGGPAVPGPASASGVNEYGAGRDNTFGGYSDVMVVGEDFVVPIPDGIAPESAAPMLCAGATLYQPLKRLGVRPGSQVGIIGFGGLGDMGAKLAAAMGAEVTVFTTTPDKAARPGVKAVLSTDPEALAQVGRRFDVMVSTIPVEHDINPYLALLATGGVICVVGQVGPMAAVDNSAVVFHRLNITASVVASIADTREVLSFCAEHGISPDIEVIRIQDVNEAYDRVESGQVRFRHVIDMASLADEGASPA